MPTPIRQFIEETIPGLSQVTDSPLSDVQVLIAAYLRKSKSWLLAHQEESLTEEQTSELSQLISQLQDGNPLPYVLGNWEFYGLDFIVTPSVLIPRPETELMVEVALKWLESHPQSQPGVDVGTGSGCIAVTLAKNCPGLHLVAIDRSRSALDVARKNAIHHHVQDQISLLQADLLSATCGPYPLICANLPYIPSETLQHSAIYGKEPGLALDGGLDGLELIRRLLEEARTRLAIPGVCLLEIEFDQGSAVLSFARRLFPDAELSLQKDLAGKDRLVVIEW